MCQMSIVSSHFHELGKKMCNGASASTLGCGRSNKIASLSSDDSLEQLFVCI